MTQQGDRPVNNPGSVPPPRQSWARRHKARAALLAALMLAGAILIIVILSSGGGTTGAGTTAAGGQPAGGTAPAARVAVATVGDKWLSGPAGKLLNAVNADLGTLSTAESAGQGSVAQTAGTRLAADAKAALGGPMPPVDAKVYQAALQDFEKTGGYAAGGAFSKATPLLNAAERDITKVTSAVDLPATVRGPAAVIEPNGQ
jgi:hypothetical protein